MPDKRKNEDQNLNEASKKIKTLSIKNLSRDQIKEDFAKRLCDHEGENKYVIIVLLNWWSRLIDTGEDLDETMLSEVFQKIVLDYQLTDNEIELVYRERFTEADMIYILDYLLKNKTSITLDIDDGDDYTALSSAVTFGFSEITEFLLAKETEQVIAESIASEKDLTFEQKGKTLTKDVKGDSLFELALGCSRPNYKIAFQILEAARTRNFPTDFYTDNLLFLFGTNKILQSLKRCIFKNESERFKDAQQNRLKFIQLIKKLIMLGADLKKPRQKDCYNVLALARICEEEGLLLEGIAAALRELVPSAKTFEQKKPNIFFQIRNQEIGINKQTVFWRQLIADIFLAFDEKAILMLKRNHPDIIKFLDAPNQILQNRIEKLYQSYLEKKLSIDEFVRCMGNSKIIQLVFKVEELPNSLVIEILEKLLHKEFNIEAAIKFDIKPYIKNFNSWTITLLAFKLSVDEDEILRNLMCKFIPQITVITERFELLLESNEIPSYIKERILCILIKWHKITILDLSALKYNNQESFRGAVQNIYNSLSANRNDKIYKIVIPYQLPVDSLDLLLKLHPKKLHHLETIKMIIIDFNVEYYMCLKSFLNDHPRVEIFINEIKVDKNTLDDHFKLDSVNSKPSLFKL